MYIIGVGQTNNQPCGKMNNFDADLLNYLYDLVAKNEGLKVKVPVFEVSCKMKGDGCIEHINKKPIKILISKNRSCGGAYVLLHEIAHQIRLEQASDSTHGAAFKKVFQNLRNKYETCAIANRLSW
jgi:Zn-dependent peptidase ImmA (M78 family)